MSKQGITYDLTISVRQKYKPPSVNVLASAVGRIKTEIRYPEGFLPGDDGSRNMANIDTHGVRQIIISLLHSNLHMPASPLITRLYLTRISRYDHSLTINEEENSWQIGNIKPV